MQRPTKFEDHRWVGDKRNQVVYDVDNIDDPSIIDELMAAETFLGFGPDTLAEARKAKEAMLRSRVARLDDRQRAQLAKALPLLASLLADDDPGPR